MPLSASIRKDVPGKFLTGPWIGAHAESLALGLVGLGAVANLLVQGFEFPSDNNIEHVPIVLRYAQSVEGPHDAFHQSLGNFTSVLWPLLSLVATEHNISALFFTVYALNRAALILFLYLAARELLPDRPIAVAAAVSIVVLMWWMAWPLSPFGGNDLFVRALSQTQLTVTALAACVWLMLRGQWLVTALVLGVAFNVNAFMAFWGGVIAATAFLWVHRDMPRADLVRRLAMLAVAAAVPALPTVGWIAATLGHGVPFQPFDYRDYIREFYPRHNLLEGNWAGVLITWMIAAVVLNYLHHRRLFAAGRQRQVVAATFAAVCGILLIGMAMPYLVNSRLLYCLFPLRLDSTLIAPLLIVLISVALARAHGGADDAAFWPEALLLVAFANGNLPLALVVSTGAARRRGATALAVLLLIAAATLVATSGSIPIYFRPTVAKSLAFVICQAGVAAVAARSQGWTLRQSLVAVALIAPAFLVSDAAGVWQRGLVAAVYLAAAASLLVDRQAGARETRYRPSVAFPLWQARIWIAPVILAVAIVGGVLRVASTGTLNNLSPEARADIDAQLWLRQHSKPDERVLTFGADAFSTLSRRPVWVESAMGAAVMWAPWYYHTWHARMADVARLGDLGQTVAYARSHHIAYIVMSRDRAAGLGAAASNPAVIYANPSYLILSAERSRP